MATRHPLQNALAPILLPLSFIYGAIVFCRRALLKPAWIPPRFCVSIGNISWGGTGKTPVTDWLLSWAERQNLRAAVLTRGYGAHPPDLPLEVSPGSSPADCGDEPLMLARHHPLATVMVDPDRNRAGQILAGRTPSPDIYILDDGFQHISTGRDIDLVLLDQDDLCTIPRPGNSPSNWNRVLPAGSWRENQSALHKASAFLLKANPQEWRELLPCIRNRLKAYNKPVFVFCMVPVGLSPLKQKNTTGSLPAIAPQTLLPADSVHGPYIFVCGIGNPEQAKRTVSTFMGRPPEHVLTFPDHHDYNREKAQLEQLKMPVICTGKDAVKLAPLGLQHCYVLEVQARFFAAENPGGMTASSGLDFETWWDELWKKQRR